MNVLEALRGLLQDTAEGERMKLLGPDFRERQAAAGQRIKESDFRMRSEASRAEMDRVKQENDFAEQMVKLRALVDSPQSPVSPEAGGVGPPAPAAAPPIEFTGPGGQRVPVQAPFRDELVTRMRGEDDVASARRIAEKMELATAENSLPLGVADRERIGLQEAGANRRAGMSAANELVPVQTVDEQGNPVTRYLSRSEVRGQTFARPKSTRDVIPSEAERRSFTFLQRAKDANDSVAEVEKEVAGLGVVGQARLRYAPNIAQTQSGQFYNQAQRQFTEARLRKDSGAAVPEHEYENDKLTYFAQPGDTKATLERKRRARLVVIQSLQRASGRAFEELPDVDSDASIGGGPAAAPAAGSRPATASEYLAKLRGGQR